MTRFSFSFTCVIARISILNKKRSLTTFIGGRILSDQLVKYTENVLIIEMSVNRYKVVCTECGNIN